MLDNPGSRLLLSEINPGITQAICPETLNFQNLYYYDSERSKVAELRLFDQRKLYKKII